MENAWLVFCHVDSVQQVQFMIVHIVNKAIIYLMADAFLLAWMVITLTHNLQLVGPVPLLVLYVLIFYIAKAAKMIMLITLSLFNVKAQLYVLQNITIVINVSKFKIRFNAQIALKTISYRMVLVLKIVMKPIIQTSFLVNAKVAQSIV